MLNDKTRYQYGIIYRLTVFRQWCHESWSYYYYSHSCFFMNLKVKQVQATFIVYNILTFDVDDIQYLKNIIKFKSHNSRGCNHKRNTYKVHHACIHVSHMSHIYTFYHWHSDNWCKNKPQNFTLRPPGTTLYGQDTGITKLFQKY
jgi:hypothetical protein